MQFTNDPVAGNEIFEFVIDGATGMDLTNSRIGVYNNIAMADNKILASAIDTDTLVGFVANRIRIEAGSAVGGPTMTMDPITGID